MKTQKTKDMEKALIRDALRKGKHPALEVPKSYSQDKKQIVWQAGSCLLRSLMLITLARLSWME